MIDNTYNHVFACSVVLFICKDTLLCAANADQPPKINEITNSVVVQPSEQIVIRAEVTLSGTPSVFVSWHQAITLTKTILLRIQSVMKLEK